jgi:hypothetical protein
MVGFTTFTYTQSKWKRRTQCIGGIFASHCRENTEVPKVQRHGHIYAVTLPPHLETARPQASIYR